MWTDSQFYGFSNWVDDVCYLPRYTEKEEIQKTKIMSLIFFGFFRAYYEMNESNKKVGNNIGDVEFKSLWDWR